MRVLHLCFHGIGVAGPEREPGEARYWIGRDLFLHALDLASAREDVAMSFDDGNRSDLDIALPALQERGMSASFFPLAGRLDDPRSLGRDDLRALVGAGMTVGSHGWNHVSLRGLPPKDATLELDDARQAITEAAGAQVSGFALPLGQYDRAVLRRLRAAGYQQVFTSDRRPAAQKAWLQPRYSLGASDSRESIRAILAGRPSLRGARSTAAGFVKRLR